MNKRIVSKDDRVYACFPDIAMCQDGTLVCVYRESMGHGPYPFSRLVSRISKDGGGTWGKKRILDEAVLDEKYFEQNKTWMDDDEIEGYYETLSRIGNQSGTGQSRIGAGINCPRLLALKDGQLLLIADIHSQMTGWANYLYRSRDNGQSWSEPERADIAAGLVPALTELRDGRLLLGLTRQERIEGNNREVQLVYYSQDKGKTWSMPVEIPHGKDHNFSEGSFVELDDGTLLGILRDDRLGRAYKVLSFDGGLQWEGPFPTQMIGLEGRPKAGVLHSGEICVSYRLGIPNEMLALHMLTQEAAKIAGELPLIEREPMPEDRAGAHEPDQPWYLRQYYPGRTVVLDMDRSVHRDSGYSGWVQLDNGDILVVDYINDDSPRAHIRSYLVNRTDYILFPDGDLPWLHPSGQPYVKMAMGMAERQFQSVRTKNQKGISGKGSGDHG